MSQKTGKFISKLRKDRNLTQKQLAEKLFITDRAVSKWERGQSMPDTDLLIPLSEILGVSATELIKGEKSDFDIHKNHKPHYFSKENLTKILLIQNEAICKTKTIFNIIFVCTSLYAIIETS